MPLYEYECRQCGHRFEVIQKFSDTPVAECEKCRGPVQKLLSAPGLQFKGSGWYITDHTQKEAKAKEDSKTAAEKPAPAPAAAEKPAAPAPTTTPSTGSGSTTTSTPKKPSTTS
jgi:putative FmdB family regulatory protein